MVELRPYQSRDQPQVLEIWWESWHSILPELRHPQPFAEWRKRWLEDIAPTQTMVVVAGDDDVVLGFAAARASASELTQLFVAPGSKRRGIGRLLMGWAKELMPGGFSLRTLLANQGSRTFYARLGLVEGATQTSPINGMRTVELRWSPKAP